MSCLPIIIEMVVLGSRTHYCVNKRIEKAPNKNDACQELVEEDKCAYKFKANDLQDRFAAKKHGQNRIWDMEDLIDEGKAIKGTMTNFCFLSSTCISM